MDAKAPAVFTRERLLAALLLKRITPVTDSAQCYSDAIRLNDLESVVMPGVRPAMTFARGYEVVFGGRWR